MTTLTTFYKEPTELLEYTVDWEDYLGDATITASTWTVPSPLTGSGAAFTDTEATINITGGGVGQSYTIINEIVTSEGETVDQSFVIVCRPSAETSGVSVFSVTRDDIIRGALRALGVIYPGEPITADMIDSANEALNMMIKAWQAKGVGLWLNTEITLPLVADATSYLLGPNGDPAIARPLGIVEARRVTTDGDETPLEPLSRDEYMALPLKTSEGPTINYYYDPQTVNAVLNVWPVNTTLTDVIKMTLRMPVQDFVSLSNTPDFPQEWFLALKFKLAEVLIPDYDVPMKKVQIIMGLAQTYFNDVDEFDREKESAYFSPRFR